MKYDLRRMRGRERKGGRSCQGTNSEAEEVLRILSDDTEPDLPTRAQSRLMDGIMAIWRRGSISYSIKTACMKVLSNASFLTFPASPKKHHVFHGGLSVHTLQVAKMAMAIAAQNAKIKVSILFPAAIFHDYGKIWDYECRSNGVLGTWWDYTDHRQRIRHISRSYAEFMSMTAGDKPQFRDAIGHCILSHHGHPEWGSQVEPQTPEAWALHLADMASVHCIEQRKP